MSSVYDGFRKMGTFNSMIVTLYIGTYYDIVMFKTDGLRPEFALIDHDTGMFPEMEGVDVHDLLDVVEAHEQLEEIKLRGDIEEDGYYDE